MSLRLYQVEAIQSVAAELAHGRNRLLLQMGTGSGKTRTAASILRHEVMAGWFGQFEERDRRVLFFVHREEIVDQAAEAFRLLNPGAMVSIEQGPRRANRYADIVVASIQTLAASNFRRLEDLIRYRPFRLVLADECFPAGTLVDGRPIESIRVGDTVTAYDDCTKKVVQSRVTHLWKSRPSALVTIKVGRTTITCTPSHPVFTLRGWVCAGQLKPGIDAMLCIGEHAYGYGEIGRHGAVPYVRLERHATDKIPDRLSPSSWAGLLLTAVREGLRRVGDWATAERLQPQARIGSDEEPQPDAPSRNSGQDGDDTSRHEVGAEGARWQREAAALAAASVISGAGLADGSSNSHTQAAWKWLSQLLQGRHRQRGDEVRYRSGRQLALCEEGSGRQEGRPTYFIGVDSVAVHEPTSDGRFGGLCADGFVYNLEVEKQHTYTVQGFVVHNCHRAASPSYIGALVRLGFLPAEDEAATDVEQMQANLAAWDKHAPQDRMLIGLTATPNRSDGVGLSAVFQSIAFTFPLRKGIEHGYLVPIVPWLVETSTNLDGVRMNRGDFNQGDLQAAVNTDERNRLAVAGWQQYAPGRPTIAFTAGVDHARALADAFEASGVVARPVSGETPKDERRSILEAYRDGRVTVLTNDSVFTEGTDLPMTSCVLMAKPTKSALLYEQAIGRGLRLAPGKKDCILLDVVDVARKHSLMTAPCLYGLPPGLKSDKGKSLDQMADAFEAFVNGHPGVNIDKMGRISIEQLAVKGSTFNIWEIPSLGAFGAGRAMNWVKVGADSFRLQFPWQDGTEVIAVAPDLLGKFAVSCTFRPAVGPARQRTLAHDVATADLAAGIAEAYVLAERRDVTRLVSKDARWRNDPASERQKAALRWRRIPHRDDIRKGVAADLLNMARARVGQ